MNSRILIMIMRILILISKESNRFVKKNLLILWFWTPAHLAAPAWWFNILSLKKSQFLNQNVSDMFQPANCQCLNVKPHLKGTFFSICHKSVCLYLNLSPTTFLLFPLGVNYGQGDFVFVFVSIFVFVFCISNPPYHGSTVSTWWNPDKMILILCCCDDSATWFSICDQNSYRWKCLLAFHSTTNQTAMRPCLGWEQKPLDLGNNIGTFDEQLPWNKINIPLHNSFSLWMNSTFAICSCVNIFIVGCFYEKCPKSISLFPCMTMEAFYMISSQHTTAALSLFLLATKNTQLVLVSFVGICFSMYFGFAFTKL